tara:strand:- start:711 stop:1958 length:1248 start_codon:yes stop_codon:yes gene_type:complete
MSYYKFKENDLFVNTIEAYPDVKFYIQSGSIYINNQSYISGTTYSGLELVGDNIDGVPRNYISLYQYNINRNQGGLVESTTGRIYPWVVKDSNKTSFKSLTKEQYNTQFNYDGIQITSSYNLSASITRYRITSSQTTRAIPPGTSVKRLNPYYLYTLRNTLNHYKYLSPYYAFSNYTGTLADATNPEVNLLTIPSIFYGSSIKKGSVNLRYYISGSLVGQASDIAYDGALVQVSGTTTGSVVGTVLYNEGFILLTSSAQLNPSLIKYEDANPTTSSWCRFGYGSNDGNILSLNASSASFSIEFQGKNHIQTMTMLTKAPIGELNNSNNPTYLKNSAKSLEMNTSGTYEYIETKRILKNIVLADYTDIEPPMQKETYISKIALYDKNRNVIGYAKLATPVRKTEDREFIFKLKLDL